MQFVIPLILTIFLFTACRGQSNTTVVFVNKSSDVIDSIKVLERGWIRIGPLAPGQQDSCALINPSNSVDRGAYQVEAFLSGRKLVSMCGFYFYGSFSEVREKIYVFDNGISHSGKPLQKPKELKLYFDNRSDEKLDSLVNDRQVIVRIDESSPRRIDVIMDYAKAEQSRQFKVVMNGRVHTVDLGFHDFSNWDNTNINILYDQDGLHQNFTPQEWPKPLEIWVEIDIELPIPADSVQVVSPIITATYNTTEPNNYKRVIFDYRKIKDNPLFTVAAMGKTYTVDLRTLDIDNVYTKQKFLWLSEKGIRKRFR
jgi:hypothetical protein